MSSFGNVEARAREYYDGIAADYDRLLDTPLARGRRNCFWRRAEELLPDSARILDFGAGSGADAEHFADLGHHVTAYDLSRGMIEVLGRQCAKQVAAGRVVPLSGPLSEVHEKLTAGAPYDAVLCNFAVFTMIEDLDRTLRFFGSLVRQDGLALICIQNPWIPAEMRTRAFWKALLLSPFRGGMRYSSGQSEIAFRHTPMQVRRAAREWFARHPAPAPACCRIYFGPRSLMRLIALRRR